MGGVDAGLFGRDGTQAAPPPRVYPDPLAGLVTGERPYRAAAPVVAPPPAPVVLPVEPARRASARRPPRKASQQVTGTPAEHVPHAGLSRDQPRQDAAQPGPKQGRGVLIGCLVVLAALGGLLFNVLREIIEAVVDLVR